MAPMCDRNEVRGESSGRPDLQEGARDKAGHEVCCLTCSARRSIIFRPFETATLGLVSNSPFKISINNSYPLIHVPCFDIPPIQHSARDFRRVWLSMVNSLPTMQQENRAALVTLVGTSDAQVQRTYDVNLTARALEELCAEVRNVVTGQQGNPGDIEENVEEKAPPALPPGPLPPRDRPEIQVGQKRPPPGGPPGAAKRGVLYNMVNNKPPGLQQQNPQRDASRAQSHSDENRA